MRDTCAPDYRMYENAGLDLGHGNDLVPGLDLVDGLDPDASLQGKR